MNPLDVLARLRLPDGRLWADAAVPFQIEDARAVLAEDGPPYHFLTRSRGSSKTTDLAGLALAMLLTAEHPARFVWTAADADQARLAIDAIDAFLRGSDLAARVEVQTRRVRVPATDARLDVLPADEASAWGLLIDAAFVDELTNWPDTPLPRRLWEAVSSAVAKRDDAKLVILATAGSPSHFSRKILDHAKTSKMWRVHEVPGPAPWLDAERLAEQKARLPDAVYRQLFENEWTAAEGSFLDPAVVDAAFVLDGPGLGPTEQPDKERASRFSYHAALDLGSVSDRTVFAIGHREGEAVHLDRMQTWQGSRRRPVDFAAVEAFIAEAHLRFKFRLRLDPWQGLQMAQSLRSQGVATEEFPFSQGSKQRLAATLLHALNSGGLRLYEADGLRDELLGLRLRQSASGSWSFDHSSGGHDDRAVSLALMLVAALEQRRRQPVIVFADDAPILDPGELPHPGSGLPWPWGVEEL
jgi:hypothetical protein